MKETHKVEYRWLAGWYATKLHAVQGKDMSELHDYEDAKCGAIVYYFAKTEWAARKIRDGLPRCKRCEQIIKKETT